MASSSQSPHSTPESKRTQRKPRNRYSETAMDSLAAAMSSLNIARDEPDVSGWIDDLFESSDCRIPKSQTLVRRLVRMADKHKCLKCSAYFQSKRRLRRHLKQERHFIDPDDLRQRRENLLRRIYTDVQPPDDEPFYFVNRQSRYPLVFDTMTPPQQDTMKEIFLDRAYMIIVG